MPTVVGIRFKKACKIYYFDPAETGVQKGDFAIVETARGVEYGEVVIGPREVEEKQIISPLKPVMRKATEADDMKLAENKIREKEAFNICLRKIKNHELPMRLIDVEQTPGGVADGNRFFRRFHNRLEQAQIVFGAFAVGNIQRQSFDQQFARKVLPPDGAVIEPAPFTRSAFDAIFDFEILSLLKLRHGGNDFGHVVRVDGLIPEHRMLIEMLRRIA